jgi:hypothetical protein
MGEGGAKRWVLTSCPNGWWLRLAEVQGREESQKGFDGVAERGLSDGVPWEGVLEARRSEGRARVTSIRRWLVERVLMGSHTFLLSRKRAVLGAKWGADTYTQV